MSGSKLCTPPARPALGALFAFIAIATSGGCFVSFDGYELGEPNAGVGGSTSNEAGASSGGRSGNPSTGGASAGNGAHAGAGGNSAGAPGAGAPNQAGGTNSSGAAGAPGAGGSAGAGAPAGGSGGGSSTLVCPDPHNRITVEIPLDGGGFYRIDRAEVKNAEYQAFVDAASPPSGQAAACAFNTSYQPATSNGCNQYDPINLKNQPVACVDWCDAAAFCKWDGKRLCGKIGGGSNAPASFADPSKSQWFRACSHAGDNELPYGNTYDGMKCIGLDNAAVHPVAVPNTNCEGGYSGLYDMSGNVAEWDDSCTADSGMSDLCLSRGGSYLDTNKPVAVEPSLLCNSSEHGKAAVMASKARSTRDKEIGFRCCSEPVPGP